MLALFSIFKEVCIMNLFHTGKLTPLSPLLLHTYITVSAGKYVAERLGKVEFEELVSQP
jgi:hypothetical protein